MATDGSGSAASEFEVGSIYPTMQEGLCAAAAKQADTCVAGGVCGMWRVEISPYVGIRIGSIEWNYGGSLTSSKTTKNS